MSDEENNMATARGKALGEVIRQQIGSDANRRLLARIGAFRADKDIPDGLRLLLAELDGAERSSRPARG